MSTQKHTVVIIDSNAELIDIFRILFQEQGFNTAAVYTRDLKNGQVNFEEFISHHNPSVLVYDISIPYKEN